MTSLQHRDQLSKHMASIRNTPNHVEEPDFEHLKDPTSGEHSKATLSLQDALSLRRPNFVKRAEQRVAILQKMQFNRKQREQKRNAWLKTIRCPDDLSNTNVPAKIHIPIEITKAAIFNHCLTFSRSKIKNRPTFKMLVNDMKK